MIFVVLGTQKFKFHRIIDYVNKAVENNIIKDDVIFQYGFTINDRYKGTAYSFLKEDEFKKYIEQSDLIICHGGVGTILNCLKLNKKVLAVPRDADKREHIDNHQFDICQKFSEKNLILTANTYEEFKMRIMNIKNFSPSSIKFFSEDNPIKSYIDNYIFNVLPKL